MRFTINSNILSKAIANASKAAAVRSSVPALEGVLLKAESDKITVIGYDLDSGVKITLPNTCEEQGEIVLNAKLTTEMLKKMPKTDIITFKCSDGKNAEITAGAVHFKMAVTSAENYPNIIEMSRETSFKIPADILKSMIKQTIFAVSQEQVRPELTGVLFKIENGYLNTVAIDGVRVALRTEKVNYDGEVKCICPTKILNDLMGMMNDKTSDKDITVMIDDTRIGFDNGDYTIFTRVINGDFVDYHRFIDVKSSKEAIVKVDELADCFDRALLLAEKVKASALCSFKNDSLTVSCQTNLGEIQEQFKIEYYSDPIEIALNPRLILETLRNADEEKAKILFTNEISPLKICPLNGEHYTYIVMPVRKGK